MRHIIILLLFVNIGLLAQNSRDTVQNGLSDVDLIKAKQLYFQMVNSEPYIVMHSNLRTLNVKLNSLDMPYPNIAAFKTEEDINRWLADPADMKRWLKDNLHKTDFKSVDEAVNLFIDAFNCSESYLKENKELFALIKRATKAQKKEIREPGREGLFETIDILTSKKQ